MVMVSEIDLFNLEDPNSIIRKVVGDDELIDISELAQRRVQIPVGYEIKELSIENGESKEISSLVEDEIKKLVNEGYPDNIYTPIYEAILNAYQHGNKRDPDKKVRFAYHLGESHLDILIEDEGTILNSTFVPFILKHRESDVKSKYIDFYKFARKEKPKANNGTGTSFMHAYMDEINYYLGEHGLMVHMVKNKN